VARIALLDLNGGKPNEAVGLLLTAIAAVGHQAVVVDVLAGAALPSDPEAVVTTGGPGSPIAMGAWQVPLRAFLRRTLQEEIPLLTICLGFQIIAGELGSRVQTLERPRLGVYPLASTLLGESDERFAPAIGGSAFEQRHFGVWHGDLGILAVGPEGDVTCARLGPAAWGCVFHPEATGKAMHAWLGREEARRKITERVGESGLREMLGRVPGIQRVHDALLKDWLSCLG
jgi:GMP synthase-like glutamine amidotransferase